jgi:hypothetical protein
MQLQLPTRVPGVFVVFGAFSGKIFVWFWNHRAQYIQKRVKLMQEANGSSAFGVSQLFCQRPFDMEFFVYLENARKHN